MGQHRGSPLADLASACPRPFPCCRFYGPALSDAFPDATVWAVPGLLEGKGLPLPFFGAMVAGMRPRCKQLGRCAACFARCCLQPACAQFCEPFDLLAHSSRPSRTVSALLGPATACRRRPAAGRVGGPVGKRVADGAILHRSSNRPVRTQGAAAGRHRFVGEVLWDCPRAKLGLPTSTAAPAHGLLRFAGVPAAAAGFCMDAAEYADLGEGTVAGARKAGVWDRLGPITRIVFERFPQVCVAACRQPMHNDVRACLPAHPPFSPTLPICPPSRPAWVCAGGAGVGGCCYGA